MLTDTKLRNLKPQDNLYKVPDRDGLYVAVTCTGAISFRYNYSIHGRQETVTFGRYGVGGITLAEARECLAEAKKMLEAGGSHLLKKRRGTRPVSKTPKLLALGLRCGCVVIRWLTPRVTCVEQPMSAT